MDCMTGMPGLMISRWAWIQAIPQMVDSCDGMDSGDFLDGRRFRDFPDGRGFRRFPRWAWIQEISRWAMDSGDFPMGEDSGDSHDRRDGIQAISPMARIQANFPDGRGSAFPRWARIQA
jgi:hypothetical protein